MFSTNTNETVLLNVPAGKPNRKKENPPRTIQPSQKSDTCMYYAYKISAICETDYLIKQKQEKRNYASQYRKSLTVLHGTIRKIMGIVRLSGTMSKTNLIGYLTFITSKTTDDTFTSAEKDFINKIFILTLNKKTKINDITINILNDLSAEIEFDMSSQFLRNIGFVPQAALSDMIKTAKEKLRLTGNHVIANALEKPDELTIFQKNMLMVKTVNYHMELIFDLESTVWKPNSKIEVLFELIQKNASPIVFYGYYGKTFYTEKPNKLTESISGYEIYGWSPNTHKPKDPNAGAGHTIAVIGVKKNTVGNTPAGWVYYIDPTDISEPNQPRKIYKMSYEKFCEYCLDGIANALNNVSDPCLNHLNYGAQRRHV